MAAAASRLLKDWGGQGLLWQDWFPVGTRSHPCGHMSPRPSPCLFDGTKPSRPQLSCSHSPHRHTWPRGPQLQASGSGWHFSLSWSRVFQTCSNSRHRGQKLQAWDRDPASPSPLHQRAHKQSPTVNQTHIEMPPPGQRYPISTESTALNPSRTRAHPSRREPHPSPELLFLSVSPAGWGPDGALTTVLHRNRRL